MYPTVLKKLLSLLTVFAMVFSMIAVVQPMKADAAIVDIAISNGDFETGAFGGAVSGSNGATIVEKATYEGNYALKFDATGEILTVTGYLAEATTAESTVTLSFWAKVLGGSTGNSVNYGLFATNESWGNRVQFYGAGYPIVGGDWKQISKSLSVPAETKIIQAQIYLGAAGITAIVDNVSITDGNGEELLQSGGFEKGALNGDFNANDALEIVCTPVNSGQYAAHADKSSGNGNITTTVSFAPSAEARTMKFSFWMYVPSGSTNSAHTQIVCYDTSSGGWTNLGVKYGAQYVTPGQWVQKTIEIAVAANTNTLQIQLYAQDAGANFYIDDLCLTEEVASVNHDVTLNLNQVTGDGTWQFAISEAPANKYYKVPATIDGVACSFLMGESGGIMCVYPNFFTALGGAVPTKQIVIEEGTVLKAVDSTNGWKEIEGADTYTLTKKIDLSYVNGVWSKTVYTTDVTLSLSSVQADGTWQFTISEAPANKYYKVPAIIDGVEYSFLMGESGGIMCVYPNFFTALGGAVPSESIVIPAGTVLKPVISDNGWKEIDTVNALKLTNSVNVENILGNWKEMSQYADVTFAELTAADLNVYKAENQAESQYRSTFAIKVNADVGNSGWANFTKVAAKVLVDGTETSAIFGMVPAGDEGWGQENAFLLYITGEGCWDAAASASSVTICAGTMIISPVDNTKGLKFTEDFTMYKNCDGSWDITADTHVYDRQNTELEGALVSEANCQSAATYYYSCACGQLGTETFTIGELGDHNYADGTCGICGDTISIENITISLQTITNDGTWQLVSNIVPADEYYKASVIVDGEKQNVLMGYSGGYLCIYPSFFTAVGGAAPTESFVIPAGTMLKAVDSNGWVEIDDTTVLVVSEELEIENIAGKWIEMSKYSNVTFTEIYGADLDVYYQNFLSTDDLSAYELYLAKQKYPDLFAYYGDDANMTTIGIRSVIPTLRIPSNDNWATFTLLGTVSVQGAEPWETYVLMTPDGSQADEHDTAADNAFLLRFYNGYVGRNAKSITIEPGTMLIAADGVTGFVFVDGYTIYRDSEGNWTDVQDVTNPVKQWGITLREQIGVSFEMELAATDTVSFTVAGNAVQAVKNGSTYTIYLAAAQMTDAIVISVNGVALEKTYSVRGYADVILAGSYGDLTKNLVKNMLAYGGAAQTCFDYNTDSMANEGIEVEAAEPVGNTEMAVTGSISGLQFYGASLLHKDKTAVHFYFTGSTEGVDFGEYAVHTKDGMSYIEIGGINPQNLGDVLTVSVTAGDESIQISYSPLNYMVRMYNKDSSTAETKALVQALYGYYTAAAAYTA